MYLSLMVLFFLSVPFAFASPLTHSFLLPCLSLYPRTSLHRLYFLSPKYTHVVVVIRVNVHIIFVIFSPYLFFPLSSLFLPSVIAQ